MIEKIDGKFYVFKRFYYKDICFVFDDLKKAEEKLDELVLNEALFTMFGKDDKKKLREYANSSYTRDIEMSFEEYEDSLYAQGLYSKREVNTTSSNKIKHYTTEYELLREVDALELLRGGKKFKYLEYSKIYKLMKKLILFRSEKQGGLDINNSVWNKELAAQVFSILFSELKPKFDEEHARSLKKYTGSSYGAFNDFLYGDLTEAESLKDFISDLINIYECFSKTPFDLYLHRGATNDALFYKEDNEVFSYKQFISTSITSASITPFVQGEEFFIKVPKGTKVIFKGLLEGKDSNENEVILLPSLFKCIGTGANNGFGDNKYLLQFQNNINIFDLIINNLETNKEIYSMQYKEEYYETMKYVIMKKVEYEEKLSEKLPPIERKNKLEELKKYIISNQYYGVADEIEKITSTYFR